jgi:hypothetical protein
MRDPLDHDEARFRRMAADDEIVAAARRMQWLKLATGVIALAIIGAILLTWRWG